MPDEGPDEGHSRPEAPSGDEYRRLADSANRLRASEKQRESDAKRRQAQQQTTAWLKYTTVGLQFVLMLLLPLGLGYWADTFFDSLPWGTLIGFALGATAAMVSIIRETGRMARLDNKSDEKPDEKPDEKKQAKGHGK